MDLKVRHLNYILLLAALLLGLLAAAPATAAVVYVEGVVSAAPDGDCVLVRDHEGKVYVLEGAGWEGVIANDYVRFEGRYVPVSRCGITTGFEVAEVATVWSDDAHTKVYFTHDHDGRFRDWVQRHRRSAWEKWDRERREPHHGEEHHEAPPPR
jgi:hypothetical protein